MAMTVIKSEENPTRRMCMADGEAPQAKCAKRRRRDSSATSPSNNQLIHQKESGLISAPTTVKRSSRFRGVSRHKWTGRYEAHLWDKLTWNVTQKKKGKQVYLGAYDEEEAAARAYDLAALKYWGASTFTNFPISDYEKEIDIMQTATKEEYLASLRSKYRSPGTQEEAARAYDIAAIEYRGINAVTNFDLSSYISWLKPGSNNSIPAQETKSYQQSDETISYFHAVNKLQPSTKALMVDKTSKQDMYGRENPFNSCRKPSSSPSALGLLLQSSVFKELVEKNSNLSEEEESDDDNTKNLQQASISDEYGGLFYDIPFVFSSNRHGTELQGQLNCNYDCSATTGMSSIC
ncbi:hypothetical protein DH2020_037902 [Rehmannia glutinosa]|uniref:AP2/ERF domain-containing protein n=1 Tax=Rehmannia glutinosa TaxID=99300 RepID=A0ABR0V1A4_REHGL